jgi:site-specific recombinase XerD
MKEARTKSGRVSPYLFPGPGEKGHRTDLKRPWPAVTGAAGISNLRIHDLRHSFASTLAAAGYSLHMIGHLLGHQQIETTKRYAHLNVSALRELVNVVGAVVNGAAKAPDTVIPMKSKK